MTENVATGAAVDLWRIGATTRTYAADDLSGGGAANDPGRWNEVNQRVVYTAPTISMAVLETAAHLRNAIPFDRYVVRIAVPYELWARRERVRASELDVGWDAIPDSIIATRFGSAWYASGKSLLLELPSVIVPEEAIVVVNAAHPDAAKLTARAVRRFEYERLFRERE